MVNDRFLLAALYDFERVDAPPASLRITGNRNPAGSEGGDFFWEKAPQIKVAAITWDLSRTVKGPR